MIARTSRESLGRIGHWTGLVLALATLVAVHLHPVWRPWLGGVVTERFPAVVWAVDLSIATQILGNGLLLWRRPPWIARLVDVATAAAGALSIAVTLSVWPFAFGPLDLSAKVLLGLALLGTTIAVLVNLARLATSSQPPGRAEVAGAADVLVAFASKHGATEDIARRVGEVLAASGLTVDVEHVDAVADISGYRAVVLGSAVYYGMWLPPARAFLLAHEAELAHHPVWLFSSGPTGEGDPKALTQGWTFPAGLKAVAERVAPRDVALFQGAIDPERTSAFERWVIRNVKAPTGDFRDWGAVGAWASSIAASLAPPTAAHAV